MRHVTRLLMLVVVLLFGWVLPAQAQTVSGFQHTSFNITFDGSSIDQVGNDSTDLVFRDVTFGVEVPVTEKLGVWLTVSKAADFNRDAEADARKLTGSYGGGCPTCSPVAGLSRFRL